MRRFRNATVAAMSAAAALLAPIDAARAQCVTSGVDKICNNTGTLSGGAFGLSTAAGGFNFINNSGTILGTSFGLSAASGLGNILTNSGVIAGTGPFAFGVSMASGGNNLVINSGVISSTPGGFGISMAAGGNNTLTSLPGSIVVGPISFAAPSNTFNFIGGNFNFTVNAAGNTTFNTFGAPFALQAGTGQIAVVDPTPFAMADRVLMDFSRTVSSSIPMTDQRTAIAAGPAAYADDDSVNKRIAEVFANTGAMADYAADMAVYKSPTAVYRDGASVWARGFVGQRDQRVDVVLLPNFNRFYGGMIGGDWQMRPDLRLGAFIGGGHTKSVIDFNQGETSSDLIFGGVYGRYNWGNSFLHGVVQVGHSSADTLRNVSNNTLLNGLETARASYDGWYVSPELTYGHHFALPSGDGAVYTLTPSFQLRYLFARFDGYTESNVTNPLTVGTRNVGDFEERGQLKLTRTISGRTEAITTSIYGGVLGVQRVGDDTIGAVLLGQTIPFATPGKDNVWAGFGGAEAELRTGRVGLYLAGEYYAFSDSGRVASARGGVRVSF
jgi:uncharacterized protein with beta-barrel porin domain